MNLRIFIRQKIPRILEKSFIKKDDNKIPRWSQDVKRKANKLGRKLLGICGDFGLVIGRGKFGKDAGRGEFTCSSRMNFSVIDYIWWTAGSQLNSQTLS